MGVEEQKEEREVLDSIFPDEITDLSDTSYRLSITLDVPSNGTEDDAEPPTILLNVSYPPAYPDVGPNLDLSSPPNAPKHPFLDVADDKAQLLDALQPTIEESLGMAMVFTLVTTLRDAAEQIIADRVRQEEAIREVEVKKKEAEENRRFEGTKVTTESFLEWFRKFRVEMDEVDRRKREEDEEMERKKGRGGGAGGSKSDEKKMSGKQLWEKGLVGKVEEEDVDVNGDDVVRAVQKLKVEA